MSWRLGACYSHMLFLLLFYHILEFFFFLRTHFRNIYQFKSLNFFKKEMIQNLLKTLIKLESRGICQISGLGFYGFKKLHRHMIWNFTCGRFFTPRVTGSDDHWASTSVSKIINGTEKVIGIVNLERHPSCKGHNCCAYLHFHSIALSSLFVNAFYKVVFIFNFTTCFTIYKCRNCF
jgi:hypothetical protein